MKPNDHSNINHGNRDDGRQGEHSPAAMEAELARAIEFAGTDNLPEPDAELHAALLEEIAELRALFGVFTVRVLPPAGARRGDGR